MARVQGISIDTDRWQAAADLLKSRAGAFFNAERGILNKGYLLTDDGFNVDSTLDISTFYGAFMFDYVGNPEHLTSTLANIEENLLDISPSGGSARYEDDNYFKSEPAFRGNPWFVTTLWLAQYYAIQGQKEKAEKYINWSLANSLPSGLMSEQISPEDSRVVGVTPLVWSHAELINTILDLSS
jgi:GH15 family glucan-1,4-alpha-glucosidase